MRILVIGAHCDDETLGCGGTMAKHTQNGDQVFVLNLVGKPNRHLLSKGYRYTQSAIHQVQKACQKACKILGVEQVFFGGLEDEELLSNLTAAVGVVEEIVRRVKPHIIYAHHSGDVNQDHRAVFEATIVAARTFNKNAPQEVLCYEVPSATEQVTGITSWAFVPNVFVDISKALSKKIQAMKVYQAELREFPHPRSLKGIEALATYRGVSVNCSACEAFQLIRRVWYT